MTNKILSMVTSVFVLWFTVQAYLNPNDPVFLLKSNQLAINLIMLLVAAGGVYLSYIAIASKLQWQVYLAALVAGIGLGAFSLFGMIDTRASFHWPLEMWDYFLLLQFGLVYAIGALSIEHRPVPIHLPQVNISGLINSLADALPSLEQTDITKPGRLQKS